MALLLSIAGCAVPIGEPSTPDAAHGSAFFVRVPRFESVVDDAAPMTFEEQIVSGVGMMLQPEWWQGAVDEVRFRGVSFELGEPGFFGRYAGAWSLSGDVVTADGRPKGFVAGGTVEQVDATTWRADRPGHGVAAIYVRTIDRAVIAATSAEWLDTVRGSDFGIGDPGLDDFVLRARTAELASYGIEQIVVRARWISVRDGDGYSMQVRCAGGIPAVRAFLAAFSGVERLGTPVAIVGKGADRFDLRISVPADHDLVGLLWGWHDLVGFRTFS